MVDTWRQSMESSELKLGNDESKIRASEEAGRELLTLLELEDNPQNVRPVVLSNVELDSELDERTIEETSKVIAEVNITDDSSGSFEELSDVTQESELDDEAYGIEVIESREKYEEDILVGVGQAFFEDKEDKKDKEEGEEEEEDEEEEEEDEEEEEEEEEKEKEVYSTEPCSDGRETLDDDVAEDTEPAEPDNVGIGALADIPLEILRDRHALIEHLRKLKNDEADLKRKNRLLQYWVARVMTKKHQTMKPEDETLSAKDTDDDYVNKLISYKTTVDEIEARHAEMRNELDNMESNLRTVLEEDSVTFGQLLGREREIGLGLVFKKSGRVISVKAIDAMIRRKVLRRDLLNRDRFRYIFYRHRYEDIKTKLRLAENLGMGMTIMDYEVIRLENDGYKEKLEERDKNIEKLCIKVENVLNILAHYREKDCANSADIYHEKKCLEIVKSEALRTREDLNAIHKLLSRVRKNCTSKKRQAGMLFAIPVVREMETVMKSLDELKVEIERMISQDGSNRPVGISRNKLQVDENRTTVTRMTRVKSEGPRKMRPGRC